MSENKNGLDLDPTANAFLNAYIEAKAKVKEWQEIADAAAEQVKNALGEAEVGLVDGKEVVRWTVVESKRIDTKKVRELLPAPALALVEVTSTSRRFSIVGADE